MMQQKAFIMIYPQCSDHKSYLKAYFIMKPNRELQPSRPIPTLYFFNSCSHRLMISFTCPAFHLERTFFLLASYFCFSLSPSLVIFILPGFLSVPQWPSFYFRPLHGPFHTTCPCSLCHIGQRDPLLFGGEESAGICCPSYFMPHCDRDPVFKPQIRLRVMPPAHSQGLQVKIRVTNTMILHFWTGLAHECLMRMPNHAQTQGRDEEWERRNLEERG